jgi:uncharacterized damage-inducible protein DinB
MSKRLLVLVFCAAALPAFAQQAADAPPTPAGSLRNYYNGNKNNMLRTADKVPEEFYGLRPGPQMEVRTLGQHLLHAATYNYLWCSQAKNEKNPNAGKDLEKTVTGKAEIVKVVTASFAYCDSAYTALTDASGAEIVDITQENGRQVRQPRMALLMLNVIHNNELYGQLVALMRMKSITPPNSEPRPAAPAPAR